MAKTGNGEMAKTVTRDVKIVGLKIGNEGMAKSENGGMAGFCQTKDHGMVYNLQ